MTTSQRGLNAGVSALSAGSPPPANVNLLTNPTFTNGLTGWLTAFYFATTYNAGLLASQSNTPGYGTAYQDIPGAFAPGMPLVWQVDLGHIYDDMTNRVQLVLHDGDWTNARVCTFDRAGAGFAARTYVMSATVPANWSRVYAMVWTLDGLGTFRVTRGDLRYVPNAVVPGGLLCGQVAPTATPTSTPTRTPTATPTITPAWTATIAPTPTLTNNYVRYFDLTVNPFGHVVEHGIDYDGNPYQAGTWVAGQGFRMTDQMIHLSATGSQYYYVGDVTYTLESPAFVRSIRVVTSEGGYFGDAWHEVYLTVRYADGGANDQIGHVDYWGRDLAIAPNPARQVSAYTVTMYSPQRNLRRLLSASLEYYPPTLTPSATMTPSDTPTPAFAICPAGTIQAFSDPSSPQLLSGGTENCLEEGIGLRGDYYSGSEFGVPIMNRIDSQVNFDWGAGSPINSSYGDAFSVIWTGEIRLDVSGEYEFCVLSDDGFRLYVDDRLLLNHWGGGAFNDCASFMADYGFYSLRLEYQELSGNAHVRLLWNNPAVVSDPAEDIPTGVLYPAVEQAIIWGVPPNSAFPEGSVVRPLSTRGLSAFASANPHLIWPDGNVPAVNSVTWNRDVGVYFQSVVVQGSFGQIAPNETTYRTPAREDIGGRPGTRPDGFRDVTVGGENYDNSAVVEIKAKRGGITVSYSQYQMVGMMEIAVRQTQLGLQHSIGYVHLITTSDTYVSPGVSTMATQENVAICHSVVWEVTSNQTTLFVVAPAYLVNPEFNVINYPSFVVDCNAYTQGFTFPPSGVGYFVVDTVDEEDNVLGDIQ